MVNRSTISLLVSLIWAQVAVLVSALEITLPVNGYPVNAGGSVLMSWMDVPIGATAVNIILATGTATTLTPISTLASDIPSALLVRIVYLPSTIPSGSNYYLVVQANDVSYTYQTVQINVQGGVAASSSVGSVIPSASPTSPQVISSVSPSQTITSPNENTSTNPSSSSSQPSNQNANDTSSPSLTPGAIAGIAVGSLGGASLFGAMAFLMWQRRDRPSNTHTQIYSDRPPTPPSKDYGMDTGVLPMMAMPVPQHMDHSTPYPMTSEAGDSQYNTLSHSQYTYGDQTLPHEGYYAPTSEAQQGYYYPDSHNQAYYYHDPHAGMYNDGSQMVMGSDSPTSQPAHKPNEEHPSMKPDEQNW